MKSHTFLTLLLAIALQACVKLDLNPLAESSTGNFYSSQTELEMAVNDLYHISFWGNDSEEFSDNYWNRATTGNPITFGTLTADNRDIVLGLWQNAYTAIARANAFLASKDRAKGNTPENIIQRLEAEARMARAYQYARLITHFGDVPLLVEPKGLAESYGLARTNKNEILQFVFSELDWAAQHLPVSYATSDLKRWTKGVALGLKARTALYLGKWTEARDAAAQVMALEAYTLHADYRDLFLETGETSREIMLSFPRSNTYGISSAWGYVRSFLPRLNAGFAQYIPTWEMLDSYECTDGLPIDESPLYNPRSPFKNRDPRLGMSIVEFGTEWLGYTYQPHPDSLTVMNYKTGKRVSNLDTRSVAPFAAFNGLVWKKGVSQSWVDRQIEDNDLILMRYAEILLMYAEAKVELNEIDASVLQAINRVRARAYKVNVDEPARYPAVTTTDPGKLRTLIKRERRVEFANEGLRYMDLIRWKIAEKALTKSVVGLPEPGNQDRTKWPFPGVPAIDTDGIVDYSTYINQVRILAVRNFSKDKQYLWPIPASERLINKNLTQNPGY
ncbi:RagB/SusD family nutrient uptake outer membrane protein [Larkinella harenae]